VKCGHPLLYRADVDPYAAEAQFRKKVRYLCGVVGHRVSPVASRDGFVEYACHCGHSFLKPAGGHATIHHPLVCRLRGHWIKYVTRRGGFAEYVCRTCGHPFCFADARRSSRS
jgi:ribosomal protein S27E